MSKMKWKIHQQARVYDGHFKVDQLQLSYAKFAGGECTNVQRELVHRQNTVAVLPYDPVQDKVVIVEQFRVGAMAGRSPWLKEIVAGLRAEYEQPEHAARRECHEETGCVATELLPISEFYTSPGGLAEWVQLYLARVAVDDIQVHAGLAQENEDILVSAVPLQAIPSMLSEGEMCSAIGIIALQWLLVNKSSIRHTWLASSAD